MTESETTLERAIEVFVRGFCFTRSLTHPYLTERADGVWIMRDAPNKRKYPRGEEYVGAGLSADAWREITARNARGPFTICAIRRTDEDDAPLRDGFRRLHFRLMATEAFMIHRLERIPLMQCPIPLIRVETQEQADLLNRAARRRQILPQHLRADPAPIRQYMCVDSGKAVAWARSIVVGDDCWCSNVYVDPDSRRRGIARAMLSRLLRDDRDSGARANILLASHAGAKLYPTMGYETIGELLMYTPPRKLPASG